MTTTVMRVMTRRRVPLLPTAVVLGVLVLAAGGGVLWHERATHEPEAMPRPAAMSTSESEDWLFVLDAQVMDVLRHKQGLRPVDLVRTHTFGWDGVTVHEVLHDPVFLRELRREPSMSPLDLVRMEARGT